MICCAVIISPSLGLTPPTRRRDDFNSNALCGGGLFERGEQLLIETFRQQDAGLATFETSGSVFDDAKRFGGLQISLSALRGH